MKRSELDLELEHAGIRAAHSRDKLLDKLTTAGLAWEPEPEVVVLWEGTDLDNDEPRRLLGTGEWQRNFNGRWRPIADSALSPEAVALASVLLDREVSGQAQDQTQKEPADA
jgi:hypothetical protein